MKSSAPQWHYFMWFIVTMDSYHFTYWTSFVCSLSPTSCTEFSIHKSHLASNSLCKYRESSRIRTLKGNTRGGNEIKKQDYHRWTRKRKTIHELSVLHALSPAGRSHTAGFCRWTSLLAHMYVVYRQLYTRLYCVYTTIHCCTQMWQTKWSELEIIKRTTFILVFRCYLQYFPHAIQAVKFSVFYW